MNAIKLLAPLLLLSLLSGSLIANEDEEAPSKCEKMYDSCIEKCDKKENGSEKCYDKCDKKNDKCVDAEEA